MKKPSKADLVEWFGVSKADAWVYVALAAIIGMYRIQDPTIDLALAACALVCSIIACPIGMTPHPDASEFTNLVKKYSYIPGVLLVILAIAVHYLWFVDFERQSPSGQETLTASRSDYERSRHVLGGHI